MKGIWQDFGVRMIGVDKRYQHNGEQRTIQATT
jgi:hypothetical protein